MEGYWHTPCTNIYLSLFEIINARTVLLYISSYCLNIIRVYSINFLRLTAGTVCVWVEKATKKKKKNAVAYNDQ